MKVFLQIFKIFSNTKGSLSECDNSYIFPLIQLAKVRVFGNSSFKLESDSNIHLISNSTEIVLSSTDTKYLKLIYQQLYPDRQILHISQFATQLKKQ